jgi:hypothetical protein
LADLGLKTFNKLYPMMIKKYQDLIVDQNADEKDKINQIIQKLNALGKLSNDVVRDWNTVYQWAMNDGLTQNVVDKINQMFADGSFNSIIDGYSTQITNEFNTQLSTTNTNIQQATTNAQTQIDLINQNQVVKQSDYNTFVSQTNTSLAQNTSQLNSQFINVLYPPAPLVAAKGDGINDDSIPINACIVYAKTNNIRRVYLPDPSNFYNIVGTITVTDDTSYGLRGLKIHGSNKGKTKLKKTTSGYIFNLNGTQEVELSNFWLEGNGSTGTTDGILLVSAAITSQHNSIEKIHFNNIRNSIDIGDGAVSMEVDHVNMSMLTLTNIFNGVRIRSYNNQLTSIDQCRFFLASGSTGSCIELGNISPVLGTSSIKISNSDGSLMDRVLTGSASFLKISGTSNQIEVDSCWVEAIDNALYISSGVGISGSVINTTFNAPMVFNYSSELSFIACSLRNIILNSGVLRAKFIGTALQPTYGFSGAAVVTAIIDWEVAGVPRKTISGTNAAPRQNTGQLGNYSKFIGCFANGASLIAGENTITFQWQPSIAAAPVDPFIIVHLLDPANMNDIVHKLWGTIALNNPSAGVHTITIHLRLSQALTVSGAIKFFAELMDKPY